MGSRCGRTAVVPIEGPRVPDVVDAEPADDHGRRRGPYRERARPEIPKGLRHEKRNEQSDEQHGREHEPIRHRPDRSVIGNIEQIERESLKTAYRKTRYSNRAKRKRAVAHGEELPTWEVGMMALNVVNPRLIRVHFERGDEGFLRNLDLAELAHLLLAFLLL